MKDLKFRAWDSIKKRIIQDYFFVDSDGGIWYDQDQHGIDMSGKKKILPTNRLTLMQFTGLLDKNKVEIYEGDIIKDFINNTTEIVEFRHGIFGSKTIDGKTWGGMFDEPEQYEVIGNIYENENFLSNFELLTNKKQ